MNTRQHTVAFAILLMASTLIQSGSGLEAAAFGQSTHPYYKPQKTSGVATYVGSGSIGNMIFTQQPTTPDQKDYTSGLLEKLEFKKGIAPDFYGRRFFPCTLKDAVGYVQTKQPTASNFKLQTNAKIYTKSGDMQGQEVGVTPVSSAMLTPSWNTAHFEGKEKLGGRLALLQAGEYIIYVDTYFTYDYVKDRLTNEKAPSNILLAAGKLPVIIK